MQQRWGWTHRYSVPLFVSSVAAVVFAGAALVAVLVGFGDRGSRGLGPAGSPTSPPAAASSPRQPSTVADDPTGPIDDCLLGSWQMVAYTELVDQLVGDRQELALSGEGAVVEYRADGTGMVDYGDGSQFQGETMVAEITGAIAFQYEVADGVLTYTSYDSQATLSVEVAGLPLGSQEARIGNDPVDYVCDGDTLTVDNENLSGEYTRL